MEAVRRALLAQTACARRKNLCNIFSDEYSENPRGGELQLGRKNKYDYPWYAHFTWIHWYYLGGVTTQVPVVPLLTNPWPRQRVPSSTLSNIQAVSPTHSYWRIVKLWLKGLYRLVLIRCHLTLVLLKLLLLSLFGTSDLLGVLPSPSPIGALLLDPIMRGPKASPMKKTSQNL